MSNEVGKIKFPTSFSFKGGNEQEMASHRHRWISKKLKIQNHTISYKIELD